MLFALYFLSSVIAHAFLPRLWLGFTCLDFAVFSYAPYPINVLGYAYIILSSFVACECSARTKSPGCVSGEKSRRYTCGHRGRGRSGGRDTTNRYSPMPPGFLALLC